MRVSLRRAAWLRALRLTPCDTANSGGRGRHSFKESSDQRHAIRIAMPRQCDVPCGRWNPQLVKPDARKPHQCGRSWDERDAEPGPDERDDREEFVGFLHDPRRK